MKEKGEIQWEIHQGPWQYAAPDEVESPKGFLQNQFIVHG
jgi:hypothetical protein